ncbi:MAG: hypothetical protein AAGC44_00425 [Planctomycetota bacterium]
MTQTTPKESPETEPPATTGRALVIARLVIVLGLLIATGVLGVSAANDLMDGLSAAQTRTNANQPEASGWGPHAPGFVPTQPPPGGVPGVASETNIPIDRDPGRLAPPTYSVRSIALLRDEGGGAYTEVAQYRVNYTAVEAVTEHYRQLAEGRGFKLLSLADVANQGRNMLMQRDGQTLTIRAWPVDPSQLGPVQPPLRASAVNVNVSLRYPIGNPPDPAGD